MFKDNIEELFQLGAATMHPDNKIEKYFNLIFNLDLSQNQKDLLLFKKSLLKILLAYLLPWSQSIVTIFFPGPIFFASLMAPAIYKQLVLKISAPQEHLYRYSAEENVFPGWKIVQGVEEEKYYKYLKILLIVLVKNLFHN